MATDEWVFLICPPQVSLVTGCHDQVSQAVCQARVRLAGSEQSPGDGFRGVDEGELSRPGLVEVAAHVIRLSGADEQVHQAVLTGGQDVQQAGELGVVAQVIMGRFFGGDHAMVSRQQDQGALTQGRRQLGEEMMLKLAAELFEFGCSALIIRVVVVREMVDLTGVDPKILAHVGVGFHQMAQIDPQLAWGEEPVHVYILEKHLGETRVHDAAVLKGVAPYAVRRQVRAQGGQVQELLRYKTGLGQAAGIISKADGRMQDHVADYPILLQPELITDDAMLSRAAPRPK